MKRRRRAYVLVDALFAVGLSLMLMFILAMGVGEHKRAVRQMAAQRQATHVAEQVLAALETGRIDVEAPADWAIKVRAATGAPAGNERVWVTVSAEGPLASTELVGLVPARAFDQWQRSHP